MNSEGILSIRDIWLASALASHGIPFYKPDPIRRVVKDGREVVLFNFETAKGGEEICNKWKAPSLVDDAPDDPVAYLKAFMHNRERLLDLVKQSPSVQIVQKDGRIFFVPLKPKESANV